jgi:hypothetical protein
VIAAVLLHRLARREAGICVTHLAPGSVIQMVDGRLLRVMPGGELDPVHQGGRPHGGIAEDSTAGRAP